MANIVVEAVIVHIQVLYVWLIGIILALMPMSFRSKKDISKDTVLVTGAGSGIGRLMAIKFAERGCRTIVLWDVNSRGLQETASMMSKYGVRVKNYTLDLCSKDTIYNTVEKVKKDVGNIDILVNNAGIVTGKKFLDCPDHLIQRTMDVNIMAHFWTVKSFLPEMIDKNHGHIISVASSAGFCGVAGLADYCASKYAAVGFDESIRFELESMGKDGVHTTVICPYYINTGMFDGVKTRFPSILPILHPDEAVDKIMAAILTNQKVLFLPKFLYVIIALKGIIPTKCLHLLSDFFEISNGMDDFKGRGEKKTS